MTWLFKIWLKILRLPFGQNEMGGRGQVAIFAALIFQVLFIFFAMVVNVGLLVHHKINLQNSVDLAAYYGAMKQAEVLNAVGHINYQIRQSWKLMAYRYRGVGMAGNERANPPYDNIGDKLNSSAGSDAPFENSCPASFCVNYPAWEIMKADINENECRDPCNGMKITLPGNPFGSSLLSGLLQSSLPGITSAVDAFSQLANANVKRNCEDHSVLSWYALGRYIFAFKNDVANRKRVLNKLANSISAETSDLKDLDGESVRTGVLNTLWKNMTYQNQASINPTTGTGEGSFEFFNSLAAGGCGGKKDDEGTPPAWLQEIFVKPLYSFMDGFCGGEGGTVDFVLKIINVAGDEGLPRYKERLDPSVISFLQSYVRDPLNFDTPEARLFHTSVGYEKNPWCPAYVRVKATTKPKVPFSPFGGVTLKATAYAKPFGGTVGPWFYKSWPQSSDKSVGNTSDQIDKVLPPRVRPGEGSASATDDYLRVDYSRYTGDQIGIKSTMTMGRMHQAIYKKNGPKNKPQISMLWFNHLMDSSADINSRSSHGDILAWDSTANSAPGQRDVEIAAIIPDQFDLAHYSIEPYWWRAYAQRIQKRSDFSNLHVRGDLGYRKDGTEPWNSFSVKDQMARALADNTLDFNTLTYVAGRSKDPAKAFTELLTSWHTKVPGDYKLDPNRFGQCDDQGILQGRPTEIDKGVPGNCMAGGRTGYSVKIVDEEFLKSEQELGGSGNMGRIKNLPP